MSVAVNDVIKMTCRMQWDGTVDIQNVFTAKLSSGSSISEADAKDDLVEWAEDIYTHILGYLPADLTFVDVDFFNITQSSPMGIEFWPVLTAGTGAIDIQATGVAAVITAFTTLVKTRGRKFFGPIHEGAVIDGYLSSAFMIDLALLMAEWITPFTGGTSSETWTPGVWRRIAAAFQAFRDVVVRNIPGYQRRRKPGVGS